MKQPFCKRLQILIDAGKFSQTDFAEKIGVHNARITEWLTGKTKNPRRSTIIKIASFFDCDPDWLATGEGTPFHDSSGGLRTHIESSGDVIGAGNIGGTTINQSEKKAAPTPGIYYPSPLHEAAVKMVLELDEGQALRLLTLLVKEDF